MSDDRIEYIALNTNRVMLTNGDCFPITDWMNRHGNKTTRRQDVVFVVAGPDRNGRWWSIDTDIVTPVMIQ